MTQPGEILVPFAKDAVREHLDKCIRYWRAQVGKDEYALYYVDACQSIRQSLLGERLPVDIVKEVRHQTSILQPATDRSQE